MTFMKAPGQCYNFPDSVWSTRQNQEIKYTREAILYASQVCVLGIRKLLLR